MKESVRPPIRRNKMSRVALTVVGIMVASLIPVALVAAQSGFDWGPTHEDKQIANLQAALATTTDTAARANIQGKLDALQRDQAAELHARSEVPSGNNPSDAKSKQLAQDRASETAVPSSGIPVKGSPAGDGAVSDYPLNMVPGSIFIDENAWLAPTGEDMTRIVLAGEDGNGGATLPTPAQGELLVWDAPSTIGGGRMVSRGYFKPSGQAHGSLRVTGATGDIVTLEATDGTKYAFDAANLKFVDAP